MSDTVDIEDRLESLITRVGEKVCWFVSTLNQSAKVRAKLDTIPVERKSLGKKNPCSLRLSSGIEKQKAKLQFETVVMGQ